MASLLQLFYIAAFILEFINARNSNQSPIKLTVLECDEGMIAVQDKLRQPESNGCSKPGTDSVLTI